MALNAIMPIGEKRGSPHLWCESAKLDQVGFPTGTPLSIQLSSCGRELTMLASALGDFHVSRHRSGRRFRPTIDLNNRELLGELATYAEVRMRASYGRIVITPSIRAAHIRVQRDSRPVFPILECYAGGGTLGAAFAEHPEFHIAAGVEVEPDYADEYARRNPDADLFLADIRRVHPDEYPHFAGLIAGLPCTDHAQIGRGLKRLAGQAEMGRAGTLFLPILDLVAARYPLFVVFENVPAFGNGLAGRMIVKHLRDLGYDTHAFVMDPNLEWNEPTTRNRWVCIGTLRPGFALKIPGVPFTGRIREYLDAADPERDRSEALFYAKRIAFLKRHVAKHAAQGHRFPLTIITGDETSCPTIPRSYHKINASGAYVATPWGPRPLRKSEIERLHGHTILTDHWPTAVEISGQGVLQRAFSNIAGQLAAFLRQFPA